MEEKLDYDMHNIASNIFKNELVIKSRIDSMFSEYTSLDMDVKKYLELNDTRDFGLTIFINSSPTIYIENQSILIDKFMKEIINKGYKNNCGVSILYLNENSFNNIENIYYEQEKNGTIAMKEFYEKPENSYAYVGVINQNGHQRYSIEDIKRIFVINK